MFIFMDIEIIKLRNQYLNNNPKLKKLYRFSLIKNRFSQGHDCYDKAYKEFAKIFDNLTEQERAKMRIIINFLLYDDFFKEVGEIGDPFSKEFGDKFECTIEKKYKGTDAEDL